MSRWSEHIEMWAPPFVVLAIWLALIPVRLTAMLLLSGGAVRQSHPLHGAYMFFVFEW